MWWKFVHHCVSTHWQQQSGKMMKNQQWKKWLGYFNDKKKASLLPYGPLSQLRKNCHGWKFQQFKDNMPYSPLEQDQYLS